MDLSKLNRETKIERSERIKREGFTRNKINLDPRSQIEHAIKDTIDDVKSSWRNRCVTECINIYLNARNLRHDLWVEYLNSTIISKANVGDIKVSDFIMTLKNRHKIKVTMPDNLKKLTPDILVYVENGGFVLIGDVSVSTSERAANYRKYNKYYEVAKSLQNNGLRVKHQNFIIQDDLNNVYNVVSQFVSDNIIINNPTLTKRTIEFARSIQKAMDDVISSCSDKNEFASRMDDIDKVETEGTSGIIIPDEICNIDTSSIEPVLSEDYLISMCKEETEKLYNNKFLDCNIHEVNKSFDKIVQGNVDREHTDPKATIKVVDNSIDYEQLTNHNLIIDYVRDIQFNGNDQVISDYVLNMLPKTNQLQRMMTIYSDNTVLKDTVEMAKHKKDGVYGPYQYDRTLKSGNPLTIDLNDKLTYGKKKKNIKTVPATINPENYGQSFFKIEEMINYYGSMSEKASFLDDTWDAKTNFEAENTMTEKEIYDRVRKTCGAQMTHSLSNLYQRMTHLKTSLGSKDNIFVAQNSSFIAVMPREHAPISNKECDMPFIFITRQKKKETNKIKVEYEHIIETNTYYYYISKLCRHNLDKISHWDQAGYKLVASASYILSTCPILMNDFNRIIGILTLLITDSHQKISEFLELVKYVSYMPFSEVSKLNALVEDKFNILIKTNFDVWMFTSLKDFINRLSNVDVSSAKKPKVQMFNNNVTRESLGLIMNLPSFMSPKSMHASIPDFIEEVNLLFTSRPKQLYGSQFIDKSFTNTAKWNQEYKEEVEKYGEWATNGVPNKVGDKFPFYSKFCYSRDAIIYAQRSYNKEMPITKRKVDIRLSGTKFDKYMHTNCSLRGAVKSKERRKNAQDYHTTSMEECLYQYSKKKYNDPKCTVVGFACDAILDDIKQEYAQSEKEQRGSGRPISTPDIYTKASLMTIEKPEQAIGELCSNNIIVPGKNKLKIQCETYKELISKGVTAGKKQIYQLTEDQSKYSENDNTRKYESYIRNNPLIDPKIKALQLQSIKKITSREHLIHRIPKMIVEDPDLIKYLNSDRTGIKVGIGWPQGMLNFISTSVHCCADIWITEAYNKAYPDNQVITKGLVHSDDSWVTVACDSLEDFKKFSIFRILAKKFFCLKVNEKKLWGSKLLGELVSNYNINGNVHSSIIKILLNCFNNLTYMNWVIDVQSQISSLQQMYRSGSSLSMVILTSTILRQQIINSYRVSGKQLELINVLPVELGGYPGVSPFELAITGLSGYYDQLLKMIEANIESEPSVIILKALRLSLISNLEKEQKDKDDAVTSEISKKTTIIRSTYLASSNSIDDDFSNIDYQSVIVPSRGEVFACVKHIMPKSKKVRNTIEAINALPFESNGLEMIITNPKELKDALGHLKSQTSTILYNLASDKYTSSVKRLAISQAIQSTGKVVKIGNMKAMTMNEMITFFSTSPLVMAEMDNIRNAFIDDSNISSICDNVVHRGSYSISNQDKRKIVNKQPETNDKFKTITDIRSILLYIIDRKYGSEYLKLYSRYNHHIDIIRQDADMIMKRFQVFFNFYNTKYACNLIMQQYIYRVKSRLWMQPHLRTDNIRTFLEDLYGKTVNKDVNYNVSSDLMNLQVDDRNQSIINSIYTIDVLNSLYHGKFKVQSFDGKPISEVLSNIDHAKLDNDVFIKYAALNLIHCNNDSYIKYYDSRRIYDQCYIRPQKMINGKYSGYFKCLVKYSKTVLMIEGEEGDITLTANNNNINDILYAMMLFVQKNFNYYSYNHPNAWASSGFWECKMSFAKLFLTSYSSTVTCITNNKTYNSIPLILDKRLVMVETYNEVKADKYYIDDTLGNIYKIVGSDQIKICHIRQNLTCPRINDIDIVDDDIDGFINTDLLHEKVIINLTLRKYYNCNKRTLLKILGNRIVGLNAKPILYMWALMMMQFNKYQFEIDEDSINEHVEVVTYDISGQCAYEVIEAGLVTTAEDLTAIETNYVFTEESRMGCLYKYDNLLSTICKVITGHIGLSEIEDILFLLLKDKEFKKLILEDCSLDRMEIQEKFKDTEDMITELPIDPEVFALVVGTDLYKVEMWENLDIISILKSTDIKTLNKNIFKYKELIKKDIMTIIYDKTDDDSDDDLLRIALSNK